MEITAKKYWAAALALLGLWAGIRYLLPLALPFLLGAGLALLAEPLTGLLCRRMHLPRSVAAGIGVSATFCLLALILLSLCALVIRELGLLAGVLPDLGRTALSGLEVLRRWLLGLAGRMPRGMGSILEQNIAGLFSEGSALVDQGVRWLLGLAGGLLAAMPDRALTLGTAVIASFMISAKLPAIRAWVTSRLPRQPLAALSQWWRGVRRAIGGWLMAQVKLSGVTWGLLSLGFLVLGIPYGLLWAVVVALVDAFPVLGTGTVLIPWSIIAFLQGNSPRGIGLVAIYAVVALVRSALEPRLVGRQLGLDPLLTLGALYAGYRLWGLGGMLMAPLLAVALGQSLPFLTNTGKPGPNSGGIPGNS